jgi:hypothetical protein
LIVNASSANLSGSNLVFGGLSLNLSGSADLSNAQVSTVTNAGGSGDITISAAGLATTAGTSLLAAHDLTLNLPSLGNTGQLAAGNNLTFNVAGDFYNSPSGLVFAGNNANLFVGGTLANDQGAILADGGMTIQGTATGQRNAAVTNVSGLIQAGGDMSILTSNLTNRRSTTPTWVTGQLVSSGAVVGTFVLNPTVAGQPFAYLESTDQNMFQLYAGSIRGSFLTTSRCCIRSQPLLTAPPITPEPGSAAVGRPKFGRSSTGSRLASLRMPTAIRSSIPTIPRVISLSMRSFAAVRIRARPTRGIQRPTYRSRFMKTVSPVRSAPKP